MTNISLRAIFPETAELTPEPTSGSLSECKSINRPHPWFGVSWIFRFQGSSGIGMGRSSVLLRFSPSHVIGKTFGSSRADRHRPCRILPHDRGSLFPNFGNSMSPSSFSPIPPPDVTSSSISPPTPPGGPPLFLRFDNPIPIKRTFLLKSYRITSQRNPAHGLRRWSFPWICCGKKSTSERGQAETLPSSSIPRSRHFTVHVRYAPKNRISIGPRSSPYFISHRPTLPLGPPAFFANIATEHGTLRN